MWFQNLGKKEQKITAAKIGKSTLPLWLSTSSALPANRLAGVITPSWLKQGYHHPVVQNLNLDREFYTGWDKEKNALPK